jgi:hypothetical protein
MTPRRNTPRDDCTVPARRSRAIARVGFSLAALLAVASVDACRGVQLRSPIAPTNGGPPSTFVQTTSDTRSTRVIGVRDGLSRTAAFRAASDLLGQKFSIDVSDAHAGFLMSSWQATSLREGAPDLRYRTRIIIRFVGDDGKQVSVRADANWQRGDEWDIGYDDKLLDDVSNELAARIGKK